MSNAMEVEQVTKAMEVERVTKAKKPDLREMLKKKRAMAK